MKKNTLLISILFLFLINNANAACTGASPDLTCASASRSDVQDCVTASTYGDTINIPACATGNCEWATGIEITKDIKIVGAGIDVTYLTLGFTDNSTEEAFFKFVPDPTSRANLDSLSDTHTFEVSGVTFVGSSRMAYKYVIWIENANTPAIRRVSIHHNKFTSIDKAVRLTGYIHGVFYSNTLINTNGAKLQGIGHLSFTNDRITLGSGNGWHIEDNDFSWTGGTAGMVCGGGNSGGGFVVRYNDVTGVMSGSYTYVETHGNQLSSIYGPQITEIYGNDMTATGISRITNVRGGKNIYMNNVFAGDPDIQIWEEYADVWTSGTYPTGKCAEPGQGVGRQTCTDACICQKVHDSYFLNNRASVAGALRVAIVAMDYDHRNNAVVNDPLEVEEDIEFFNYDAAFDGTSGCGCGALGDLPATCTTGVGYWATDQNCSDLTDYIGASPTETISGTLYKCTSTDTWESFFTPYTYPHPLRGESSSCGDGNCDDGECISGCTDDCSVEDCCGIEGCNVTIGETVGNCPGDCSEDPPPVESGAPGLSSVGYSGVSIN